MYVGDRLPKIRRTLQLDGAAVDLTGASLRFRMRKDGASANAVDAVATIVTPASGIVEYAWAEGDTSTPGVYTAEWEVTFAGGLAETWQETLEVKAALG